MELTYFEHFFVRKQALCKFLQSGHIETCMQVSLAPGSWNGLCLMSPKYKKQLPFHETAAFRYNPENINWPKDRV